ncbi:ferredoxin reductase [Actinoplanes sp. NPDC049548]|uniref:ferredoxin reductase n=1 Tax=Actinoplanes sp. NPDC049548 TaxID=3155152 RepID=UPI003421EC54
MAVTRTLRSGAWRVVELITTPLVPADYLDQVAPLRNASVLRAKIVAVRPETANSVTLTLRPGRNWRPHVPGQYVRLGVDVDGVRLWRSYSVTSAPRRGDERFTVTVNAIPGGVVSTHLVRHAKRGMILHLDVPAGEFTLPPAVPAKALFVTAGSGITPVMGILRSHPQLTDVVVVHSARTAEDVVFGADLRALATQGRIRLVERHTRTDGRIKPADLDELVPDLFERETWACGPNELLDDLEEHWEQAGARERLRTERFRPTVVADGAGGGSVAFTRTGKTVEAGAAEPLLEAGEAAGVLMPSGCRMGICFKCVLPLREGAVRDLRDGTLTVAEPGDSILVQTCINAAAGPCRIEH